VLMVQDLLFLAISGLTEKYGMQFGVSRLLD